MEQLEEQFEKSRKEVQECQKSQALDSCLKCPQILECEKRKTYVQNTYLFLNGGQQDGGFDF